MKKIKIKIQPPEMSITLEDLAAEVSSSVGYPCLEKFIVYLDASAQDWGVTCNLIAHFKALELEYLAEMVDDEKTAPIKPKKIKI